MRHAAATAADDFAVPAGQCWTVSEVDAAGLYYNGSGPASSVNVSFFADAAGLPGSIASAENVLPVDNAGSFVLPLDPAVKLSAATAYWVSVQAVMAYSLGGQWGWESRFARQRASGSDGPSGACREGVRAVVSGCLFHFRSLHPRSARQRAPAVCGQW
jgi:hypothetical protein